MNFDQWFSRLPERDYPQSATFTHYFVGEKDWLKVPDTSLTDLTKYLPAYIKHVFVIGCGSGKEFLTFDGKYSLFGTDIADGTIINWVKNFKNLKYKCISVEDATRELKRADVDMSDTLVISQGVLMYVSPADQQDFYTTCKAKGCKNFILAEYSTHTTRHGDECLHLGPHIVDFLVKSFRGSNPKSEQPNAHINLDISDEAAGEMFEEFIPENIRKPLTTRDHASALLSAIRFKLTNGLTTSARPK